MIWIIQLVHRRYECASWNLTSIATTRLFIFSLPKIISFFDLSRMECISAEPIYNESFKPLSNNLTRFLMVVIGSNMVKWGTEADFNEHHL